jgi:cytochrome d ubiquinol oxidase subunit I
VLGVGAYTLRAGRFPAEGRVMMTTSLSLLAVLVPLQIVIGDRHGLNTLEYQPAKLAGIEALWEGGPHRPFTVFAIPNQAAERNDWAFEIPDLGSLILTHSFAGAVQGLKDFPADQRPPVAVIFFSFRIMVGLGLLMLAAVAAGWWLRWRDRLFDSVWYLRICQLAIPIGFLAVLAGWTTTEVGRQPWTVYGLLRTADSVTPSLTGSDVLASLLFYVVCYLVIYPTGVAFMIASARKGPAEAAAGAPIEAGRPQLPVRSLPAAPQSEELR